MRKIEEQDCGEDGILNRHTYNVTTVMRIRPATHAVR